MFQKKQKKINVPTIETTQVTVPTLHGLASAGASAVEAAKQWSEEQAQQAADWTRPRLEQGRDALGVASAAAAARAKDGNDKLSELVDQAKDKGEQARDEAANRREKAVQQLRGQAKKGRKDAKKTRKDLAKNAAASRKQLKKKAGKDKKSGGLVSGLLTTLGVLAIAGAVGAYVSKKQSRPADDPWARPLTDPYVAPQSGASGKHADPSSGTAGTGTSTTSTTGTVGTAAGATAGATSTGTTSGNVPVSDPTATPEAHTDSSDVVDLTAGGMPPQSGTTGHGSTDKPSAGAHDDPSKGLDEGRRID